ncbi:MAG TPA: sugar transferase [Tepidisphaeraceae bacterium]|jgi:lipopolysaccharide/colanic/teichoic acid biosynthesis glycosyltransferase|nr:sugar transferase [Tepidisphaeraceae bacterium]
MISQTTLLSGGGAGPTVWGLTPTQLHDRYWAARGIQVVRQGEPSEIVNDAELFLLTDPRTLTIFKLARVVEMLSWIKPDILFIRIHDGRERGYRERIVTGQDNLFVRFERLYAGTDSRLARVALTPDRRLAHLWQMARDPRSAWREIRKEVERAHRSVISVNGSVFDRAEEPEVMQFMRSLMQRWPRPDATVNRISQHQGKTKVWADQDSAIDDGTTLVGPLWVGAGRKINRQTSIVGPKVLWDDPASRPPVETLQWQEIEPSPSFTKPVLPRQRGGLSRATKRLFDIIFATIALTLTLPLYPFVMLAIWLEDGRPFFFAHRRETLGGRVFNCLKFRSMRKDADAIKARLAAQNQADGPQFFMDEDPRLTAVGKFIRKTYIDELPQFFNVLMGAMSIVGPRPSPHRENQYCPPWREARLSVRPGITGLWQVRRTRRRGMDFQEWIKYDIEYVENISWRLDLAIIWQTICVVIRGVLRT